VRHYAKPGISGWAQVNGFRETKERAKWKTGDSTFGILKTESLLFKIIYLTVFNVSKGRKRRIRSECESKSEKWKGKVKGKAKSELQIVARINKESF
jgi:lipopolysaccharide/colanic/teichoic acid biosynthesis glycosyltransferase